MIPANDDAIRSIRLFTGKLADACIEGKARHDARGGSGDETEDRDAASERREGREDRGRRGGRGDRGDRGPRRSSTEGTRNANVQIEHKTSLEGEGAEAAPASE